MTDTVELSAALAELTGDIEVQAGNISIKPSDVDGAQSGGALALLGGDQVSAQNDGGQVSIAGGAAHGDGSTHKGGRVLVSGGESAAGESGDILLQGFTVKVLSLGAYFEVQAQVMMGSLPTTNPHIDGVLWIDTDRTIKVSQDP